MCFRAISQSTILLLSCNLLYDLIFHDSVMSDFSLYSKLLYDLVSQDSVVPDSSLFFKLLYNVFSSDFVVPSFFLRSSNLLYNVLSRDFFVSDFSACFYGLITRITCSRIGVCSLLNCSMIYFLMIRWFLTRNNIRRVFVGKIERNENAFFDRLAVEPRILIFNEEAGLFLRKWKYYNYFQQRRLVRFGKFEQNQNGYVYLYSPCILL